jgi:hypothetical protein
MLKKSILIIIILTSLKFYQLIFIPEAAVKASEWLGIGMCAAFLLIFLVYGREKLIRMHFALPIALIFVSVALSMFGANLFQGQSFVQTAYAQRVIYFYLIYFLLHFMKIEGKFIVRSIIVLGVVYIVLYLAQYNLHPRMLTSSKMFLDRGTLRIFIAGAGYLVIGYFIWLYLAFRDFRLRYAVFLLLSMAIFVLLGTRQVLGSVLLLTIIFILRSRVVKSKVFFFGMIALSVVPVFYMFQDVLLAMFEVTLRQSKNIEGYIRIESGKYFLTEFFHNDWAYLTGNGAAARSSYALRMTRLAEQYGFYQSDIGLIGEYTKFGLLYVIGVVMILVRTLRTSLPDNLLFIRYNFLGILFTLITAAGAFGSTSGNVVINSMLFYLIDCYKANPDSFEGLLQGRKKVLSAT